MKISSDTIEVLTSIIMGGDSINKKARNWNEIERFFGNFSEDGASSWDAHRGVDSWGVHSWRDFSHIIARELAKYDGSCTIKKIIEHELHPAAYENQSDQKAKVKLERQLRRDGYQLIPQPINQDHKKVYGDIPAYKVARLSEEQKQEATKEKEASVNPKLTDGSRLWKEDCLRIFISHSSKSKKTANLLKQGLERQGFSCFVAHDDIHPTLEWPKTLKDALKTMDILLALAIDDFADSAWANQEVGFALGYPKPFVTIMYPDSQPPGFLGDRQGIVLRMVEKSGNRKSAIETENLFEIENAITTVLGEELRTEHLIKAFEESYDYDRSDYIIDLLKKLKNISEEHIARISKAFEKNSQVRQTRKISNNEGEVMRLLLKKHTGKEYEISNQNEIREIKQG